VRYVQLDAYWYESLPENMSFPGCIRGWRGMPSLFPGGVAAMRAKLGPGGGPAGSAMPLHLYHSFFCQPGGGDLPGGRPRNEYATPVYFDNYHGLFLTILLYRTTPNYQVRGLGPLALLRQRRGAGVAQHGAHRAESG
jgi:hypothetical protein